MDIFKNLENNDMMGDLLKKAKDALDNDATREQIASQLLGNTDNIVNAIQGIVGDKIAIPQELTEKLKGMDAEQLGDILKNVSSIKSLDDLKNLLVK